jgi:hypothetical protein
MRIKDGHMVDVQPEALLGLSDEEAVRRARELLADRRDKFGGFEVWAVLG